MKCKRRKAAFGIDDAIFLAISAITAGKEINDSIQNRKRLQEQQRATNMANIDEQNLALQQNLGQLANNRDYITDRQNDVILNTRNTNQLKYGGEEDKYAARDNTRTRFVPGTGYVPNARLNKNTGKDVQYDAGPLGFVPVVGDVLQGGQAVSDFKNKNYKRAVLNAGLLFIPNILERTGKSVGKVILNATKKSNNKKVVKSINNLFPERVPNAERTVNSPYEEYVPSFDEYAERIRSYPEEMTEEELIDWYNSDTYKRLVEYDNWLRSDEFKRLEELKRQQKAVDYLNDTDPLPFKYGGQYKDRFPKQMFRLKRR